MVKSIKFQEQLQLSIERVQACTR